MIHTWGFNLGAEELVFHILASQISEPSITQLFVSSSADTFNMFL